MSEPLATVAQLAAFLGREIDSDDPAALQALDIASSSVRAYCGHHVSLATDDVAVLDGTGTAVILLPAIPISEVASVSVNDVELTEERYRWSSKGFIMRQDGLTFPSSPQSVQVTYTHGWAEIPPAIVGVVVSLAGRMLDGSAGIKQESLGSYSVTYASPTPTLQAAETMALDPFRVTT